jgi:hypothetical protein
MLRQAAIPIVAWTLFACCGGASWAQCHQSRDAWLMENYRFTGPPPPGSIAPTDPVVSELRQIQNTLLSIMRTAQFDQDYGLALAAAAQATELAPMIGAITQRVDTAAVAKASTERAKLEAAGPTFSIVLKDHTVSAATSYWTDGMMLHYITPSGAHIQVRLDLVDRELTVKLNRAKQLEFNFLQ